MSGADVVSGAEAVEALVIGAGPAGLAAAEMLGEAGLSVVVADAMPSPARKFLMAGKSGLNLTRDESAESLARALRWGSAYFGTEETLSILNDFPPEAVRAWAEGLGVAMFTGSTARVFPVGMKASPLLRAWLARLEGVGVTLRRRWHWAGLEGGFRFATPEGVRVLAPRVTVLALGGASWPRLGSTGDWVGLLAAAGVPIAPFRPANMGFRVDWSPKMARFFGQPVKGVAIRAGGRVSRGEWVVTPHGIEGGGIYTVAAAIRDGARAVLDLAPDLTAEALTARALRVPAKTSRGNRLRRVLGDPLRAALALEWGEADLKAVPMPLGAPLGLQRAISSAGGIRAEGLTPDLELRALPGVFAAGEMLDWEAPTGGYLLSMCLASGRRAGLAAARLAALDQ